MSSPHLDLSVFIFSILYIKETFTRFPFILVRVQSEEQDLWDIYYRIFIIVLFKYGINID